MTARKFFAGFITFIIVAVLLFVGAHGLTQIIPDHPVLYAVSFIYGGALGFIGYGIYPYILAFIDFVCDRKG